MSDEGVTGPVKLPARVYPGVFPGEYQVTVEAAGREINLNVGKAFVEFDKEPADSGVDGFLRVQIIKAENGTYLVALPGEVQGESSRVAVPRESLTTA